MSKNNLSELTKLLRYDIIESTTKAGSGHPTSSLSAVELMTALWFDGKLHYDFDDPKYIFNDRMIFSKGHASPLLYSLYQAAGQIDFEELMTLRKFTSRLEGHPTNELPWVDVATGSLGQGLSVGLGMSLGIKYQIKRFGVKLKREPVSWVLMGDSEFAEGQIYEALQVASYYKLNNLVGILDVNRLGQRGETMLSWDMDTYKERVESFGWNTVLIEKGNDIEVVKKAFDSLDLEKTDKPTMIIAKTKKGAGVSSVSDKDGWHGKPLSEDMMQEAMREIGAVDMSLKGEVSMPEKVDIDNKKVSDIKMDNIGKKTDSEKATREAYATALEKISKDESVVVLDAETSNSTYSESMKKIDESRFFEMFIAEQNMVSCALGMSKVGLIPYASSFSAFLSRAYDQIRMSQYSAPNLKIVGSHAGVSIGEDGSSQMALEDIAMMQALLHSTVLYPSDPVSTIKLVEEMRKHEGLSYLRLTRAKTATIYDESEDFPIGGSKVVQKSDKDKATIFAAGITLHEAQKAYKILSEKGISVRILDMYSIKPLDKKAVIESAKETKHVVIVEDHYPEGGLGSAIKDTLCGMDVKITHLAVGKTPRSGTSKELLEFEKIDANAIVEAVLG